MRQTTFGLTRATSLRQLPTDHDHVGRPFGLIHEYQIDQPSSSCCSPLVRLVDSLHQRKEGS